MSKMYRERPSKLLDIAEPYTAFCLDEACAYIINQLEAKKEPKFVVNYSKPSDLYEKYE